MNLFMGDITGWIILIAIWTIPWKGVALWKAARLSHRNWFIIILVLNSLALVDIYYIFFVAKKYTVETIEK
jgi:hypothetical protein